MIHEIRSDVQQDRGLAEILRQPAPLLLVMLLVCLTGCKRRTAQGMQMPARPPAMVTTVAATVADVPVYLDEIGKTVAVEVVSIVPQVGGKIIAAHVENGAYVRKGDLLFQIDPRPYEAALAAAKSTLAQNQAELDWAKADFKRIEELISTNVASQLEYDQKKSALGVAEAKIEAAKSAIQTATLNLEYTQLRSPIDGRAGARLIDPGNVVRANDAPLLVIQRLDPIYAEFSVNENDLGTVRKFMAARGYARDDESRMGLKVLVDVPGDSARILSALGGVGASTQPGAPVAPPREGRLSFLDNTVQANTGTVKLRATVPNPDRYLWPGQFVNVRLVLTTRKNAVLVPVQAQQISQQGPFVYVVRPDGTAELRLIAPGQRQGDALVVESGIQPGEQVIVTGHMMVAPGGPVVVTNEQPAQTAQQ